MTFLVLDGLTKTYGDVRAVDNLTCTVEKGEFVSLLGPSGCGKTTTLQMIAGFETPTSGRIELAGRNLASIPARQRGLGIVFQTYALFMHMTVRENVSFGLEMRKVSGKELKTRVVPIARAVLRLRIIPWLLRSMASPRSRPRLWGPDCSCRSLIRKEISLRASSQLVATSFSPSRRMGVVIRASEFSA